MLKTSIQYNIFSAVFAFFMWGGWSYYINYVENSYIGLISGLTQGVASFVITLVVVHAVTKIHNVLPKNIWRKFLPAIIVVSFIAVLLVLIHSVVGTPHVFDTILPSLTVGFLFCLFTTYKLRCKM